MTLSLVSTHSRPVRFETIDPVDIGQEIDFWRDYYNWSASKLARLAGVDRARTIFGYEGVRKQMTPTLKTILRLCVVFKINLDVFCAVQNYESPPLDLALDRTWDFGQRLYALRVHRGYRVDDVAAHCGLKVNRIKLYERGLGRVSLDELVKMSNLLQASPVELLGVHDDGTLIKRNFV